VLAAVAVRGSTPNAWAWNLQCGRPIGTKGALHLRRRGRASALIPSLSWVGKGVCVCGGGWGVANTTQRLNMWRNKRMALLQAADLEAKEENAARAWLTRRKVTS